MFSKTVSLIRSLLVAAAVVSVAAPQAASAAVIFQSVPDLSDASKLTSPWCSSCGGTYRIFDKFTLLDTHTITGFSISLYNQSPYWPQDVNFSIWTFDGANNPLAELFSQTIAGGSFATTQVSGADALIAETNGVTGLTLGAGTYYASFYNSGNPGLGVWGYTGGGGNLLQQQNQFHQGTSAGFTLTGSPSQQVPEPATLALLGLALIGATVARRRA